MVSVDAGVYLYLLVVCLSTECYFSFTVFIGNCLCSNTGPFLENIRRFLLDPFDLLFHLIPVFLCFFFFWMACVLVRMGY